ncbi:Cytochrome P450 1A1 [Larimichthys crocea]|uniref:Cytochrome P450 1A n=2 Tax=Larimichthys crocea TaxID=215358 RepID=C7ENH3_LARCR|nr:cytochrome P450 1A1 [Larimichthys crocea]ACT64126.1 cytochrome P4501A [Larimichthys crocea]KAE8297374.1 Cytochrome P450 1A1 [Larimichthys crocea]TMS13101.1 Cytochrome P450 1A1 [Larimichthys crocea]
MVLMILPFIGSVSVSEGLVAITVLCLVYLALRFFHTEIPEGLRRLPGPKPFPLIGNVLEVGSKPYLSLTAMSKRYGDVFQIQIGMRPVIVLSGSDTVRQALIKQGEEFAGRPDLYSFRFINDGKSLAFSTDQAGVWRARRKLAYSALRSFSSLDGTTPEYSCMLEEHICKEGEYLIKQLNNVMKADGSFDPFRHIVVSVANVICGMCFGRRYDHNDQELLSLVNLSDEFGRVVGSGNPADFIPVLQYLPSSTMKSFMSINARFSAFVQKIVIEHYATYNKDNIRDITDSLIDHCEDRKLDENSNVQMSDEKIVGIVNDLFGAGFDTISTALSWSVMYLVAHPEMQERLHQELKDAVGLDRTPRLSDRPNLPFLDAFILELFRHSSFLPFTIPHCTSKNTSLNGYFIPKDTCVFINQWQMNHDPEIWKDPSSFNPDRFLSADGTAVNKMEGEKVMLFGMGKRRCIGEVIARNEVYLFLAILAQKLQFQAKPGQPLDMTPEYGLTMKHKRCHLRATMRVRNKQ